MNTEAEIQISTDSVFALLQKSRLNGSAYKVLVDVAVKMGEERRVMDSISWILTHKKLEMNSHDKATLVKKIVSDAYKIEPFMLESVSREWQIVLPRQVCMWWLRLNTNMSLKAIGRHFGHRDHSTVIHSMEVISDLVETDNKFRDDMKELDAKIRQEILAESHSAKQPSAETELIN